MEPRHLDCLLFNKAYDLFKQTGIVPQNATDADVRSLLSRYESGDEKDGLPPHSANEGKVKSTILRI